MITLSNLLRLRWHCFCCIVAQHRLRLYCLLCLLAYDSSDTYNRSNILPESCVSFNVCTVSFLFLLSLAFSSSLVCRLRVCVEPYRGLFLFALGRSLSGGSFNASVARCNGQIWPTPHKMACLCQICGEQRPAHYKFWMPSQIGTYSKLEHPPQTPSTVVDYATQNAGLTYHHPMAHPQPTRAAYVGSNVLDIVSTGCRLKSEVFGTLDRRSLVNSTAAVSAILIAGHQ